jgi:autotransporter-associated beta strand protein/T5SS/PEP-CTERM-associated repeat protein
MPTEAARPRRSRRGRVSAQADCRRSSRSRHPAAGLAHRLGKDLCEYTLPLLAGTLLLTGATAGAKMIYQDCRADAPWVAAVRSCLTGFSSHTETGAGHAPAVAARGWMPWSGQSNVSAVAPARRIGLGGPAAALRAPEARPADAVPARVDYAAPVFPSASRFSLGAPAPASQAPVKALRTAPSVGGSAAVPASAGTEGRGPMPNAAGQTLYVDTTDPGQSGEVYGGSSYTVSSGTTTFDNEYVGYNHSGTFTQNGGTNVVSNTLYLGYNNGSSGTYMLSGTGSSLSTGGLSVGPLGAGTFIQSGGTFTDQGIFEFYDGTYTLSGTGSLSTNQANIVGGATFTQSGGSFTTNGSNLILVGSTYTLSGTGSSLSTSYTDILSGGTFHLNGGTLTASTVSDSGGTSTFDFNGGTLQAGGISAGFFGGLTTANVQTGGAFINTNGFNVTVSQNLLHDTTSGAPAVDGGLTKLGAGTLTLTGNNTYTGGTTLDAGVLNLGVAQGSTGGPLGGSGTVASVGTISFNGGTLQYSTANTTDYSSRFSTAAGQAYNIDTNGQSVTFATGLTSSGGGLTKLGAGTLTLSGNNTDTGPTAVNAGTLALNGSLTGNGLLTVASGATLAGTGMTTGSVSVLAGGTLSPGRSGTGSLMLTGSLTLASTATAAFTLGGTTAMTQYTQVLVSGQIDLDSSTLSLTLSTGYQPALGDKFYLLDTGGRTSVEGTFANAPMTGSLLTEDGVTYAISYVDSDPSEIGKPVFNDVSLTVVAVVPEPGVWLWLGAGLGGLLAARACSAKLFSGRATSITHRARPATPTMKVF